MDELVQWFGEQLDIDALVAREATPGPWQNAPTARHHVTASGRSEEAVFASPPDVGAMVVAATGEASERRNLINAEFIAAHDPARVLREIDAKRKLLSLHRPVQRRSTGSSGGAVEDCQMCGHFPAQYPCGTLRLLALPYSDRPGYEEGWAP